MTGYRNILVAVGPHGQRSTALRRATAVAVRDRARLTVILAFGAPPALIYLSPGLAENPQHTLQRIGDRRLRALTDALPRELSVTTMLRPGNPVEALLAELRHDRYDLLVLGEEHLRRWRWRSRLSRGYLRNPVALLDESVPDGPAGLAEVVARVAPVDDLARAEVPA